MSLRGDLRAWAERTFGLSWKDEIEFKLAYGAFERKVVPVVKVWFSQFWTDPAYFTGLCRSMAYTLAGLVLSGAMPIPEAISHQVWWGAVFVPALAALFPAGQTNKSAGEIKAIALDPSVAPALKP